MLNLGPAAYEGIQRLKNNSDWRAFVTSLEVTMSDLMHRAIEASPDTRVDACGYARGLRDLLMHISLVEQSQPGNRAPRTPVKLKEAAHV